MENSRAIHVNAKTLNSMGWVYMLFLSLAEEEIFSNCFYIQHVVYFM